MKRGKCEKKNTFMTGYLAGLKDRSPRNHLLIKRLTVKTKQNTHLYYFKRTSMMGFFKSFKG